MFDEEHLVSLIQLDKPFDRFNLKLHDDLC